MQTPVPETLSICKAVRTNGSYLLRVHSCPHVHYLSAHYSIYTALLSTLLEQAKNASENIWLTILTCQVRMKPRLHLLKLLDRFACKSCTSRQCRRAVNPTAIANKTPNPHQQLTVPISPCLPYHPFLWGPWLSLLHPILGWSLGWIRIRF